MGKLRLNIKEVTKVFPGVIALNNVSLQVYEGEIVSLVGENGAGKSTLMKILSGTYPYGTYSGEIYVNGKMVKIANAIQAENHGIAIIPQELNVQLDMTVAENIMLGHWPKNKNGLVNWKRLRTEAKEALGMMNIDFDVDVKMRSMNASMQQLICIAKALRLKPSILILDEPTAALTLEETAELMKIIRKLKADGISCIYISHKLDEVFDISDRIVVMRNGRVVSEYSKEKIVPKKIISDMIGREMEAASNDSAERQFGNVIFRAENMVVPHPFSPNKNIIDGVSISVRKGEILGLGGLVGSGRSELLRAIYGALPKTKGEIYIEDKKCIINSPRDAISNGLFMVSEDRKHDGYVADMTVRENMTLSIFDKISKYSFFNTKKEKEIVGKYIDYLKIKTPSMETYIRNLSGGNQQKVIIARALTTDMKVLFLDEPTRGIDVGTKAEIYKIIWELAEKGLSIIVISSEMPELIKLCDRFVILRNGRIAGEFLKKEISEQKMMEVAALDK
jgi:D-xylose transport system ATP-binding protein